MTYPQRIRLGDEHTIVLDKRIEQNLWRVIPPYESQYHWLVRLRQPGRLYKTAEPVIGWISTISQRHQTVYVHDTDYGRLPVSMKMHPRYLTALFAITHMFNTWKKNAVELPDVETLSEFRGMLGRCAKTDQADWFTLFKAFGLQDGPQAINLYRRVIDLQKRIKFGDTHIILAAVEDLAGLGLEDMVRRATQALQKDTEALLPATTLRKHQVPDTAVTKTTPNSPVVQQAPPEVAPSTTLSLVARRKLEWSNETHQCMVKALALRLEELGYTPEYNMFIDLTCQRTYDRVIFEIKSVTPENWLAQIRSAVAQLYEYRYIHGFKSAKLCLVLSSPPLEDWVIPYLQEDREIEVAWLTAANDLGGPGWNNLFNNSKL